MSTLRFEKDIELITKQINKAAIGGGRLLIENLPISACNAISDAVKSTLRQYKTVIVTNQREQRSEIMAARNGDSMDVLYLYVQKSAPFGVIGEITTTTQHIRFSDALTKRIANWE